ncbi:hypothetical protein [Enterococcus mediterraneensis]|uniref:hypothetical protein n=1 Tax=Enterococcus mediterraneensis TaxID=2364791 RepID=UPI000F070096|nr:hypothetical protein [Enterococcus mediterraneensis]
MKARKKPVVVEVLLATTDNRGEIRTFVGDDGLVFDPASDTYYIKTLEGNMKISVGDYIIKGVNGEFYPCKPDIFEKTYEIIKE